MIEIWKKGLILLGIYIVLVAYLLLVSIRVETLDKKDKEEIVNVSINYRESQ